MKTQPITLILTLLFCFSGSVLAEKKNQDDAKFKVDVTGSDKSQNLIKKKRIFLQRISYINY